MKQGITDKPVPPWELPGAFRRDCEPHRAGLLLWLSGVSLFCGAASFVPCFFGVPALFAIPLGLTTWALARRDVALMQKGLMGPGGEAATRRAQQDALWGAALPFLVSAVYAACLTLLWVVELLSPL